jgi:long-chain acyl-CoA synthetase
LPEKKKDLIEFVPCNYFINTSSYKISFLKKRKKIKLNKILVNFRKKKRSGLIIFSSGSTGFPKIILHDFNLILNKFKKERPGYKSLLMLSFDHLGGINTLLASLLNKNSMAICLSERTPEKVCPIINKTKAELLPTTPTFLNMLLISKVYKKKDISSLKIISFGAEKMPESLLGKLIKEFPKMKFKQTYGLSEFGVMRSKNKSKKSLQIKVGGEDFKTKIIDNTLFVKSKSNMIGYLNLQKPFDKYGWINTGDKVKKHKNGFITILGRENEIINIGGEKVYPQEIESLLLKIDIVADANVYKNNHPLLGEHIIAELSLSKEKEDYTKDIDKIRNFCKKMLPKYKVPSKFLIKKKLLMNHRLKKVRKII